MVRAVNENKRESSRIVELVGLAGAGKTTLSKALCQRDSKIVVCADIELRKIKHIPIFMSIVPRLFRLIVRRNQPVRMFTWDEIKALAYLMSWPNVLRRQASKGHAIILLEHGPIFKLAMLDAFGPAWFRSKDNARWWDAMYELWAETLDMVIWLEAPQSLLVERINGREQRHLVKGESREYARRFLALYRASYAKVLAKTSPSGKVGLRQFDTYQTSVGRVVDELMLIWGLVPESDQGKDVGDPKPIGAGPDERRQIGGVDVR